MRNREHKNRVTWSVPALLLACAAIVPAGEPLTEPDALSAMRGMAGYYRIEPDGDVFLYPIARGSNFPIAQAAMAREGMQGMQGMEGMPAMGGVAGYFRLDGSGRVEFYPYPSEPVGMTGARLKR